MTKEDLVKYNCDIISLQDNKPELRGYVLNRGLWRNMELKDIPMERWNYLSTTQQYMASQYGRIKSLARTVYQRNGHPITIKTKILQQRPDRDGYLICSLSGVPGNKNKKVHILCLNAFRRNTHNKPTVNHENGIRCLNELYNLTFATTKENVNHAFLINKREGNFKKGQVGQFKGKRGFNHPISAPVICIKTGVIYGSMTLAADAIGVNVQGIWSVCNGKSKTTKGLVFKYANK